MYCDTRLILRKLEARFPQGSLGSSDPDHRAIERLLERWTVDAGVFVRATQLIPSHFPNLNDPAFQKDREQFSGRKGGWNKDRMDAARPEAVAHIRDAFELIESTLLADGREWIFKTKKPSLGDIEAIWPLHWLVDMEGALPASIISPTQFPKVFAWISRFRDALKQTKSSGFKPTTLSGDDVVKYMQDARFVESAGEVDVNDPLGLRAGEEVEVWPIETGFTHRDRGTLLSLTPSEVVVGKKTKAGGTDIHLHMPRWGFRISRPKAAGTKL